MDEMRAGFWLATTLLPPHRPLSSLHLHLLTPTLCSALWLQDGTLADTQTEPATFV